MNNSGRIKSGLITMVLLMLSIISAACGGGSETSATPQPVDRTKDRIMFLSNRDGWPDLYTTDQSGKSVQRLTESAAAEYGGKWSPDGKRVVFTELEGDQASGDYGRVHRVVAIDADGKNRKVISNDGFNPSWSPDGTKILFMRAGVTTAPVSRESEFYSANIIGAPPSATVPGASPTSNLDNRSASTPVSSVSSLPPRATPLPGSLSQTITSNSGPTALTTPQEGAKIPSGLPATPQPVSGNGGGGQVRGSLYIAPADGSATLRGGPPVLQIADNTVGGAWSTDGKRIAFIAGNNDLNSRRSLFMVDQDGNNKISLSDKAKIGELDILYLAWSPDGTSLAFTATDTVRNRISLYRLSSDGSNLRRLTDYNGSTRDLTGLIWAYADYFNPASRLFLGPVWSPNSLRIAFTDGGSSVSVVEADTGNRISYPVGAAALGQDKDSVLNVSWLADNRRLIYDRAMAGRNQLLAQANYFIFDFFEETLEILDTVNKNTSSIGGSGYSFFSPLCCGLGSLNIPSSEVALSTTSPKPEPHINGAVPEGKLVYVTGVGQRRLIVNDFKTNTRTTLANGIFKLLDFSLSPRSDRLIYLEVGDKYNAALYLSSFDGKQKIKLSEGTGDPDDLSNVVLWSPDGNQVAYQVLKGDSNLRPGLYVLSLDSNGNPAGGPRLITDKQVTGFSWSPDSRQIAYKIDSTFYELWLSSLNGEPNSGRKLAQLGVVNPNYASLGKGVAWSPNGQMIALSGPSSFARFSLWLVSADSGQVREVLTNVIARIAGWTPDSSRLFTVIATFSQNTDIQALNLNTGTWRPYGSGSGPQVSTEGLFALYYSRLDYRSGSTFSNNSSPETPGRLLILRLLNGDLRSIPLEYPPYFGFKSRFFTWSPDGKAVAYYTNNSIYGTATDGQNPQELARAFTVDKLGWSK